MAFDNYSRRNLLKVTTVTTTGIAASQLFIGLVSATDEYDNIESPYNPWWTDYQWNDAGTEEIPGDGNESVIDIISQAIAKRHQAGAGTETDKELRPNGELINPTRFTSLTATPTGDDPKVTFIPPTPPETEGKWRIEFKAGYK